MVWDFITGNLGIIICLIASVGLVVLETFLPGVGLPGISGVLLGLVAVGLTFLQHGLVTALCVLLALLGMLTLCVSISLRSAAKGRLSKSKIILKDTESEAAGYRTAEDLQVFIGKEGKTLSTLRPAGIAEFDGVRLNVSSEGDFIDNNTAVRIVRVEGGNVVVRATEA